MSKFINIFTIYIFATIFLILIYSYIFFFSINHIINLWTYSEIHLNYSTGFIRRGLLGEVLITLENIGISKNFIYSSIFFLFSLINIIFFTKIIKNLTHNIWLFLILSLNPSLILFNFYDLGGYARFETFGISLIFLHTLYIQNFIKKKIKFKQYVLFYFFIILPLLIISILIHEINILISSFHFMSILLILKMQNIKIKNYFLFLLPWTIILFLTYFFFTDKISEESLLFMFDNLKSKDNVHAWVWTSIFRVGQNVLSEFNYMINPISNVIYYIFIFIFFLTPIFIIFKKNSVKNYDFFYSGVVCIPLFFLFILGRDWGRWIHLIIILFFCFNAAFIKNYLTTDFFKKYKNIVKKFFIIIILFQFTMTRIPHCCNLIEKEINLIGGLNQKIIVFYKLLTNQLNVNERFKKF